MTSSVTRRARTTLIDRALLDPNLPLFVMDLASVETYLLVRALSYLASERDGAIWCPLPSRPAALDDDIDAARNHALDLGLPLVTPERHPAPVPRAMRIAALAAARSRAAIFTLRATRLAWSSGADLDRLEHGAGLGEPDPDDDEQEYLRLIVREIGLDVREARLAAREGSDWDSELRAIAERLAQVGIAAAPALRWRGRLYTGLPAISGLLAESERLLQRPDRS